jgi:DNA-binding transcriptional MerR regulator
MQRLYFSISEVSERLDEAPHILRYWEKEFPHLKPKKNRGGNRMYTQKDIELLILIKKLLRNEALSLKGAKDFFKLHNVAKLEADDIKALAQKTTEQFESVNEKKDHSTSSSIEMINLSKELEVDENDNQTVTILRRDIKEVIELMKQSLKLLKN